MDSRRRSRGGTPSYLPKPVSKLASSSGASQDGASEPDRQHQHSTDDLSGCDWQQLEEKYTKAMEEHGKSEEELRDQISKLLEVFTSWSQTTVVRDEERALKRFKTQSQHVQNSEETLENKKKHYAEVVKAFESALALLNARMRP